jgi:hypothetical protein
MNVKVYTDNGAEELACVSVTLSHGSTGMELQVIETEDGFKVIDVAKGRGSLAIVPSSGNSIIIK